MKANVFRPLFCSIACMIALLTSGCDPSNDEEIIDAINDLIGQNRGGCACVQDCGFGSSRTCRDEAQPPIEPTTGLPVLCFCSCSAGPMSQSICEFDRSVFDEKTDAQEVNAGGM